MENLDTKCREIRKSVLCMLEKAGSGHAGGSLSIVEAVVALYYYKMRNAAPGAKGCRDHFILSKGHGAPAVYAVLADKGFFPKEELDTLRKYHSRLQGHPDSKKLPGIEISTGSLGQGVSIATGLALGIKRQKKDERVFVLLGDGETNEGLVWEAAAAAAAFHLDNLYVLIDSNRLQLDGPCSEIMDMKSLADKYRAFGFKVSEVHDGNDISEVISALDESIEEGKPNCIILNTVKGKGVSFMENEVSWHGRVPDHEELLAALKELGG